jgi:hypothetical protein
MVDPIGPDPTRPFPGRLRQEVISPRMKKRGPREAALSFLGVFSDYFWTL